MTKRIKVTVDGAIYHAVLQHNPLADKIASMCPFTLNCMRSMEHEYYAALPGKADAKGCQATTTGHRNGLYYFEGWNALSLVFQDCNTAPYKIHHIGDFEDDISSVLEKSGNKIQVRVEME